MMPERKSIHERLERSLALAREAGFPNDHASLDEKSFMDAMYACGEGRLS